MVLHYTLDAFVFLGGATLPLRKHGEAREGMLCSLWVAAVPC